MSGLANSSQISLCIPRRDRRDVNSCGSDHPSGFGCFPEHLADEGRNLPVMSLHHGRDLGNAVDDWAISEIVLLVVDHECAGQSRRKLKYHLAFVLGHVCLLNWHGGTATSRAIAAVTVRALLEAVPAPAAQPAPAICPSADAFPQAEPSGQRGVPRQAWHAPRIQAVS